MSDKVKFHIGDILSLLIGEVVSSPDKSPIGADGIQWPARDHPMVGVIQLVEHATGIEIPKTNGPSGQVFYKLGAAEQQIDQAREVLEIQFPRLVDVEIPDFSGKNAEARKNKWIQKLEKEIGAYLEVESGSLQHRSAEIARDIAKTLGRKSR